MADSTPRDAGGFTRVSEAPTNPHQRGGPGPFGLLDLYRSKFGAPDQADAAPDAEDEGGSGLDEKLRQAYFWIVNKAIISPFYDIEFHDGPDQVFTIGDTKARLTLPSAQSYSSFVLLPLLNLVVRRRCLLIGGPGRGKTASAMLMGLLAGYSVTDMKRAIQHGQPQMTIADLLGNPLPADLVGARKMEDITIAWRSWLSMRVKIIDEYNRIPTRTQSALLTVMSENYAEILDQVYECPEAAWYLTANDDAGGGTYPVIEALRDRIDIVVRALHFNSRFLGNLLERIEADVRPERLLPPELVFSEAEIDRMNREVLDVELPWPMRRRLEFFASQFELCEPAAEQFEYKTKDTLKLSSIDPQQVFAQETGKDKVKDLGTQTRNGLSVRSLLTLLVYVKAMAYFRGGRTVELGDLRQVVPFVLHDKLTPHPQSPFFDVAEHAAYRVDRIGWIRKLFDLACAEYDRLGLDKDDPVRTLHEELDLGLDGVPADEVRKRMVRIERLVAGYTKGRKLYGHLFDDLLDLKYIHQRYSNYLRWLQWKK